MNVMGWADQQLEKYGEFEALIYQDQSYTNRALHESSCRLASGLLGLGIQPGQCVALWLSNGPELVLAFTAVLRAGAVAVIVSDSAAPPEVERILTEVSAKVLITPRPWSSAGLLKLDSLAGLQGPWQPPVPRQSEDLAQIVYTSGSSGQAKQVGWRHGMLEARYREFADLRPPTAPPRRSLCALPLAAAFGSQYLYLRLLQKMQLVLLERFQPEEVLSSIARHKIQTAMLVPSMAEALLVCAPHKAWDVSSLGSLLIGGSTVSPSLVQRLRRQFQVRVTSVYGLSELGPVARTEPGDSSGTLGALRPGVEFRIVSEPGQTLGEIQLRAPLRERIGEDWLATGDLGFVDEAGQLRLVGRRHEQIVQGGVNVYPQPIEEILMAIPQVQDCAVVGVAEPYLGEEVVAWIVRAPGDPISAQTILTRCRQHLDWRRAPTRVYFRDWLPRNELGKILRQPLQEEARLRREQVLETPFLVQLRQATPSQRLSRLSAALRELAPDLDPCLPLGQQGLDSMAAVQLTYNISDLLGQPLPATLTFDYPTLEAMAQHLIDKIFGSLPTTRSPRVQPQSQAIAMVGCACRLPAGINSPEQFWNLLLEGRHCTAPIVRWKMDRRGKSSTDQAALLEQTGLNAEFFGLSGREARALDPQHRIVLEVAWQALEHAGYAPRSLTQPCGVFLGITGSHPGGTDPMGQLPSMAAGRIAHLLNLRGPALAIDTACSSGLVAVHTALLHLRTGQCDMALAGGVNVIGSPDSFVALSQMGALSSDGLCKAFDARADGFGRGEGCVLMVFKRLEQALAEGDSIMAVIRGAALNHDGRSTTLTAPNGLAQQAVARAALEDAGLEAARVAYLEAHGSGTPLGDPIEIQAATAVFERFWVGSVKSNLGHLEAAAGAIGLLKAALVVNRRLIPPHLHFQSLHPALQTFAHQITIPTSTIPLPQAACAAVMSLGMSGTNACVIVDGPPARPDRPPAPAANILCISARTEEALSHLKAPYTELLEAGKVRLEDLCYTAAVGREHFAHRVAVVGPDQAGLAAALSEALPSLVPSPPRLAFLFTGQGSLYPEAGSQLCQSQPAFRLAQQRCWQILGGPPRPLSQPALFTLEWSLAQLWQSWGIMPDLVMGHSLGELVAACLADVLSLEDALQLAAARGDLMAKLPGGAGMAWAPADEERVRQAIGSLPLDIAASNGPSATVVSGCLSALASLGGDIEWRPLDTETAFHSRWLDPMLDEYEQLLASVSWNEPKIDMVSSLSGRKVIPGEVTLPAYWRQAAREKVQFWAAMKALCSLGATHFLEVGAQPVLLGMGRRCLTQPHQFGWVPSLCRGQSEPDQMLRGLATLYQAGCNPDWQAVFSGQDCRRISIPTYPFHSKTRLSPAPPQSPTLHSLAAAALGLEPLQLQSDDNLLERGLDSLRVMQFLAQVQTRLGRECTPADLAAHPTLASFSAFLKEPSQPSPLVCLRASGQGVPLFCIHPAGGQITAYLALTKLDRPLYAISAHGHPDSLQSMACAYARLIEQTCPDTRLALLGWSLGGVIAQAVAGCLEELGREVVALATIDPPRPGLRLDRERSVLSLLHNYSQQTPTLRELRLHCRGLATEQLLPLLEARGWLAEGLLSRTQFLEALNVYQRHGELLQKHQPGQVQAPIWMWRARSAVRADYWRPFSAGPWREFSLGGDHFSLMRSPQIDQIGELLCTI